MYSGAEERVGGISKESTSVKEGRERAKSMLILLIRVFPLVCAHTHYFKHLYGCLLWPLGSRDLMIIALCAKCIWLW